VHIPQVFSPYTIRELAHLQDRLCMVRQQYSQEGQPKAFIHSQGLPVYKALSSTSTAPPAWEHAIPAILSVWQQEIVTLILQMEKLRPKKGQ
jgi:hypothetical protein